MSSEKAVIKMDNYLPPVVFEEPPLIEHPAARFDTLKVTVYANNRFYGSFALPIFDICFNVPVSFVPSLRTTKECFVSNIINLIDSYANILDLVDVTFLTSPPVIYPFLCYAYGETISDVIKPTIKSDNYYAFPSWFPPEQIYLQFVLDCKESYITSNEGLISKVIDLHHECLKLYESLLSFDLLHSDVFTNEFETLYLTPLLTSHDVHPFLYHKYERGIVDTVKPVVDADNYYAYPSWAEIISTSLLVLMPIEFQSYFQSIGELVNVLSLITQPHVIVPTDYLNLYLSLNFNPQTGACLSLLSLSSLAIHPDLASILDSYIRQYVDADTFSSSVRSLNVPINLFLNCISSISFNIRFSQNLNTASKITLESMLEDLVSMPLEDTYSSERITKAALTVSTEAAFVPLIQMVYEYSLIAPLLFSPILTTVKKSKALIKYLTIDIKKFNIDISIETIEREDG